MGDVMRDTDFDKASEIHDNNVKRIKEDVSDLLEESLASMYKKAVDTYENQGVTATIKLKRNKAGEWKVTVGCQMNFKSGSVERDVKISGSQLTILSPVR